MKKRFCKILTSVMISSIMLSGCGEKKETDNPVTFTTTANVSATQKASTNTTDNHSTQVATKEQTSAQTTSKQQTQATVATTTKQQTQATVATTTKQQTQTAQATTQSTSQAATKNSDKDPDAAIIDMLFSDIHSPIYVYNLKISTYAEFKTAPFGHILMETFDVMKQDKDNEFYISSIVNTTYDNPEFENTNGIFSENYVVYENNKRYTYSWNIMNDKWTKDSYEDSNITITDYLTKANMIGLKSIDDLTNVKLETKTNEYVITGVLNSSANNYSQDSHVTGIVYEDLNTEIHFDKNGNITSIITWVTPGTYDGIEYIKYRVEIIFLSTNNLDVTCPDEIKEKCTSN